jgi:RNA polymerase sigma-70 factor, ECF subfamily
MNDVDQSEIQSWYESYGFVLYRRCRRILGSEAEARDAVQEVFLQAWRHRRLFRREAPALHWLQRITTRLCCKRLRQRERAAPLLAEEASAATESTAAATQQRDLVVKLLQRCDERTREIAVAVFVEGLLQSEVAEVVGISERAVRKRLDQFKKQARTWLSRWEQEGVKP